MGVSSSINKASLIFVGGFHNSPSMTGKNFRAKGGERQRNNIRTLAISFCHDIP